MTERSTKAVVFTAPGKVELRRFALPPCGDEELICETMYSFVSPGTELRVLAGTKESKGRFPVIPGYSWVGRVIEVGRNLKGWREGDLVTGTGSGPLGNVTSLWGGQAGLHRVPVSGYGAGVKLPDGAEAWEYVAVEVGAIAWRAVSMAFPAAGETAVVVGQGLIGGFALRWLRHFGARVIAVDRIASRLERARRWGASEVVDASLPETRERLRRLVPEGADLAFETSGSRDGVTLAQDVLRQPAPRRLDAAYPVCSLRHDPHVWPRLSYVATYEIQYDGMIPGGLTSAAEGVIVFKPLDRTVGDRLAVIERIRRGDLRTADILERATPVEEAQAAYARLRDDPSAHMALAFDWR